MMKRRALHLGITLSLGLAFGLALLWALSSGARPALAQGGLTRYVSTSGSDGGNDCTNSASPCRTVQHALDQPGDGDEILVATGVYTGVQTRAGEVQVLYITETVTVRGGYNAGFTVWDPSTYTTTLDAEQGGRVVYVTGDYTATLETLQLTGGSTVDRGGGLYARWAHLVISGSHIFSNTAEWGGGVYVDGGDRVTLADNTIYDNEATVQNGGGVYLTGCPYATVTGNVIYHNEAYQHSGGVSVYDSEGATLTSNQVYSNTAQSAGGIQVSSSDSSTLLDNHVFGNTATDNWCGGIRVTESHTATLTSNHVYSNTANSNGGGVCVWTSFGAAVADNHVYSNTAGIEGGGLHLSGSTRATLTGNHVYSNTAGSFGGGIHLAGSFTSTLAGNQVYNNTADAGGGIYAMTSSDSTLSSNEVYSNTAGSGGGVYVMGSSNITLTTNHVYSNTASTFGGGVLVHGITSTVIVGNQVYSNSADYGGGIRLSYSDDATLRDNDVHDNTAAVSGGGIGLSESDRATLFGNDVHHNTAESAAGINVAHSPTATLTANDVYSNTASSSGGGLALGTSHSSTLTGNRIHHNTAAEGGGVHLLANNNTTMEGNWVYGNTTIDYSGGGFYIRDSASVELVNNMVTENRTTGGGYAPGIFVGRAHVRLSHSTIARNTGGDGSGIRVESWEGVYSSAWLTNTILVSHTVGISVAAGNTATLHATLWGNGEDWRGAGDIVTGSLNVWGHPGFVDPDGGDYHITGASAARDAGVDAGVSDDIDGEARPFGAAPDLGADEVQCVVRLDGTFYGTVQDAIDAAGAGDVIQVAGTCRGVQQRTGQWQVAYITETLTIRGGYSGDFSAWDPQSYPTTLDAEGLGRVVYVQGSYEPTLEALRLTNGALNGVGAGVYAVNGRPTISACVVYSNAGQVGGGIFLENSAGATVVNTVIADNRVTMGGGAGVHLNNSTTAYLLHTTIARNSNGSGVTAGGSSTAYLTNTIVVSHTTGVQTGGGGSATLVATLWGSGEWANGADTSGSSIDTGSLNWWGDPAFVDHEGGNYHIGARSAAFERGVSTGVNGDIDGDPRSIGLGMNSDLGADEALPTLALSKSGPVWYNPGAYVTYTLRVTNTGIVTAHMVSIVDVLPAGSHFVQASDGVTPHPVRNDVSWLIPDLAWEGGVITKTFTVTGDDTLVNEDYSVSSLGTPVLSGTVIVTSQLNSAPNADAGAPQSLHVGTVDLDGSGSSDPDGHALSYLWSQAGGPASVVLSGASTSMASFTAPSVAGTYTFTLVVTDAYGMSDAGTTGVEVTNTAPAADAGGTQTVHTGAAAQLDGSGSSDPDGDALTYGWTQTGGTSVVLSDRTAEQPTFTAPSADGVLTFSLTVTDTFGATDTDVAVVTVANAAPVADAGTPQSVDPGAAVSLDGSGSSDPDGDALTYGWTQTGGTSVVLSDLSAEQPTFTAPGSAGALTFSLTVTDTFGLADTGMTTVTVAFRTYLPLALRQFP